MDFMAQVQSHLMSQQYDSVLKKANLKNYGGSRPRNARIATVCGEEVMKVRASVKKICRNCKLCAARVWCALFAAQSPGTSSARARVQLRNVLIFSDDIARMPRFFAPVTGFLEGV